MNKSIKIGNIHTMVTDFSVRCGRDTVCIFMMMSDIRHCTGIQVEYWNIHACPI